MRLPRTAMCAFRSTCRVSCNGVSADAVHAWKHLSTGKGRPYSAETISVSWATVEPDACSSLLLQSIGNIYIYAPIYNINIWKVNEVQMPSCPSSHRETADMDVGARLLQVTNTCDTAVGGRVQCCDRNSSGRDFLPSFAGLAVLVQISHRGGRRRRSR